MSNDPPHTTTQTLSASLFHPVKDHWYCQCLVHGAQRALVHGELFSTVSLQAEILYTPLTTDSMQGALITP
ncbi:hypothetical protein E2C01_096958 [Portunus trituberculatus]|uniref:Uncharacterized protein n=1 Tax=Portunus trituberculatus TaxID=210409 RepID=A0A5B7JX08_PORTR|nr:hypothetical protein [Portunus trituberculatus]